ncbi:hypothetical protein DBR47_08415 [Paucibacter sp. KBW04]|uniref:sensor histidine kinase n=1 Tax=Paucibacter sp. KBW04 TaxID=2153361 RepID=UPI000F575818|nr:histidine kinase [Paucibacter sp. KBW04]RQO60381.1 hypothetical protein DBR47_08415 [Paucibacter sp. KBW04]
MQDKQAPRFDWSLLLCPGPKRRFTPEEMRRGGNQPWPKAIDAYVALNIFLLLIPSAVSFRSLPPVVTVGAMVVEALIGWIALLVARHLWRKPTRLRLNLISFGFSLVLVSPLGLDKYWLPEGVTHKDLAFPLVGGLTLLIMTLSSWWFLVIYRVHQIDARLRELDEQERNLKLARRLATAQIQPHFLFNTLASVQHWVDTQDPRAGSTLRSFTAYLRATLPMFERESLTLSEELQIVRSYLEVMKARLGERLQWTIEQDPSLDALQLPPGLLLTLAENAIAHGIEPALGGGRVQLRACLAAESILLEVEDDGAGLSPEAQDRVGLSNSRERLLQRFGPQARLSLLARAPGTLAQIALPLAALQMPTKQEEQ